jgi:metallo-beta-lactamase family protein
MHQGTRMADEENREPFAYDPKTVDAVLITHAHIDHIGLLPKLVRGGFHGKIFTTAPTKAFAEILLEDSQHILAMEAREVGEDAIYDKDDVAQTMRQFEAVTYHEPVTVAGSVKATFYDAGHVLGSAFIVVEAEGKRIAFSGDLGNSPTPLLRDREALQAVDAVVMESTYGDRIHEDRARRAEKLHECIENSIASGGTLLIASFAFERAQELLAEINEMVEHGGLPKANYFLDSPLAIKATAIYQRFPELYNEPAQEHIVEGDIPFRFPGLAYARTADDSKAINDAPVPKVIIASSGMMTGGRILHHAIRVLPDPKSTLLIVGYQAAGTLGRRLLAHPKRVHIMGHEIPVRCNIRAIGGYSAHADQETLVQWVATGKPGRIMLVHGEEGAALALADLLRDDIGVPVDVPRAGQRIEIA